MVCSYCTSGNLIPTGLGVIDRYDYAVFRCSQSKCARQTAILVVKVKSLDRRLYDQMIKDDLIDPRFNVIRPWRAA
jgi:hypothetical protein